MTKGGQEARIVRKVQKKIPWTAHLIHNANVAFDLNLSDEIRTVSPQRSMCATCKGSRMLCGKARCPILTRLYSYLRIKNIVERENIEGSSPPAVFIGRMGYPHVYAGPLVPPFHGDTRLYASPEQWFGKTIEEIVDLRFKLIRGKHRVNVTKPHEGGRILENVQFLAMAEDSVNMELALKEKPRHTFVLNDSVQPIGPSALMKDVKMETVKLEPRIENAYYDHDLKASTAITELYRKGVLVSKLQRALSMGVFGVRQKRRLVPTRWSITAVDSIISQEIMDGVRHFPLINEFRVYESNYLDNRFEILMMPNSWKYEAIEAWYPGTIWNPRDQRIHLIGDWEGYRGRTRYARMGGCYYAARLAVNEILQKERRQATVLVMREAHSNYIMPVGVWQVRENVRNALRQDPLKFNRLKDALKHITGKFDIRLKTWIDNSKVLKDELVQMKITNYV